MKNHLKLITAALLFILTCTSLPAQNKFKLDYKMAEKTIEWLEFINTGADDNAVKEYFMNEVAPTEGCKTIIQHWARFRDWNNDLFYDFILEALGRKESGKPLIDENGNPTFFAQRQNLWQNALLNPQALREIIKQMKEMNIEALSEKIAKNNLPAEAELRNGFYIVVFGHSNAFSVGERNGFDLLQLPREKDGSIDTQETIEIFAHELHHTGFSYLSKKYMKNVTDNNKIILIGILAAEGMPTYLINKPHEKIEKLKNHHNPARRQLGAEAEKHLNKISDIYKRADNDIALNLKGEIGLEEIFSFWMAGYHGPAYDLGANMFSVIDKHLGRDRLLEIAKDYRTFLDVYNEAAKIGIAEGEKYFLFDDKLAKDLLTAGE
ncbi:DUF5700 domain-containing putative Zn-dependent protease [Bacteroidota bacterium]